MPKIQLAIPVLPAVAMAKSLAFYTKKLGFKEIYRDDKKKPKYVVIERDGVFVHLNEFGSEKTAKLVASQTMCRFRVDDVDALYKEYSRKKGVIHPNGKLGDKPWGTREFGVLDPAGNCLSFVVIKS
jgi:catechol 2,3-dioxygenase-like lactoylglutathione lyase family enzyme